MKIADVYPAQSGLIATATTDDGSISYSPIANDRLIDCINGREMWRGRYPDADGFYRDNTVPADTWNAAVALMAEVDAHNNAEREAIRQRAEDRDIARIEEIESLFVAQPNFARSIGEPEDL